MNPSYRDGELRRICALLRAGELVTTPERTHTVGRPSHTNPALWNRYDTLAAKLLIARYLRQTALHSSHPSHATVATTMERRWVS